MTDLDKLRDCYWYAGSSRDPRTQNGAIVFRGDERLGYGYNDLPRQQTPGMWEDKNRYINHAERSAVTVAWDEHGPLIGCTLYGCWVACKSCAHVIIASGIREVVGHRHPAQAERYDWNKSIAEALEMLSSAGVAAHSNANASSYSSSNAGAGSDSVAPSPEKKGRVKAWQK